MLEKRGGNDDHPRKLMAPATMAASASVSSGPGIRDVQEPIWSKACIKAKLQIALASSQG